MSKYLARIGIVSVGTLLSRMLGLARDMASFAVFGVSALHSAFLFAFTVPNLFRRLLGEGALTAAFVPTFCDELEESRKAGGMDLLNRITSWLFLVSLLLALVCMSAAWAFRYIPGMESRWYVSAELAILLLPYMVFVCLAAVFAAALNVFDRFGIPALSAVWLNLAMIVSLLLLGPVFAETAEGRMYFLCAGVLVGGFLQMAIPAVFLMKEGWRPRPDFTVSPRVREIAMLMLPGLAGTAIFQVNVIVSRSLALFIDEAGVSILYLANRLMELPLGIFTIAVATVVFPMLSRSLARNELREAGLTYTLGLRIILVITLPATVGILLLREPMLSALFVRGAFSAGDTQAIAPVLALFALALPFYSVATLATRGFHSLKDTRTPVVIAGVSFLLNFALSVALMLPFGILGLAVATLVSVFLQSAALQVFLIRKQPEMAGGQAAVSLFKIIPACLLMGVVVLAGLHLLESLLPAGMIRNWTALVTLIPTGIAVYFGALWIMKIEGREDMEAVMKRFFRGKADTVAPNL